MKKRVLIIDDSALMRQILSEILSKSPDLEVIGTAVDPIDAREKIKKLNPDVLTLDIEMPNMNGIDFLEKIMKLRPMPVVMISTLTQKGANATLQALEIGAVDIISKPSSNISKEFEVIWEEIRQKVVTAANAKITTIRPIINKVTINKKIGEDFIIAMGSSTGGVEVIRSILSALPDNLPPIIITQHMPDNFIKQFAARLNSISDITVAVAKDEDKLSIGHAYVAGGGSHFGIKNCGTHFKCKIIEGKKTSGHRPSVDVMFDSVAQQAGKKAIGVILTGMGADGAIGLKKMHDAGAYNIGQNEASCVVYGMPKRAFELGGVNIQLSIEQISKNIIKNL